MTTKENLYVKNSNLKCFLCFQFGHMFNKHPQYKQLHYAKVEEEAKITMEGNNQVVNKEVLEGDEGDILGEDIPSTSSNKPLSTACYI